MYYILYLRMWDGHTRIKYLYVDDKYDLFAYIGYYKCTQIERIDFIAYEEKMLAGKTYEHAKSIVERYLNR